MHEVESSVGVDDFHDGHRSHQEEKNFASFAQMVQQAARSVHSGVASAYGIKGPTHYTHQQGRYGFVDLQHALQSYA